MRNRKEIFDEMESMLGRVPLWMLTLPDATLEHDWELFKTMELNQTSFSPVQKHLMGVTVAATQSCPHMTYWHSQMAMALGATDTEVDEAIQVARHVSGWSTALEGMNPDMVGFVKEVNQITGYLKETMRKAA